METSKYRKASAPPSVTIPIVQQQHRPKSPYRSHEDTVRSHLPSRVNLEAKKAEFNERVKELNAKTSQLITAHKNAQAANAQQGRSISLGQAPLPSPSNGFFKEKTPTIVEIPPSPNVLKRGGPPAASVVDHASFFEGDEPLTAVSTCDSGIIYQNLFRVLLAS